jgi:hypothetical protein
MRGLAASSLALLIFARASQAQPPEGVAADVEPAPGPLPDQEIGYGAMPGGIHAADAETLPKGAVEFTALGGFGYRKGLLGDNHRFGRGIGDLAIAYAPTEKLTLAFAADGRYDRHYGIPPSGDDGYVGDPRFIARFAQAAGTVGYGVQIGVWVPGKNAPSIAPPAISVDARGLLTFRAGPATLSIEGGFRLDNSAKSIDNVTTLSEQDRVSLGVSSYNAAIGGAHLVYPMGKGFVGAEVSTDVFFGNKAPPGAMTSIAAPGPIIRGGVTAGVQVSEQIALVAFVEIAKVPDISAQQIASGDIPLIPYEPAITGGIGLQTRFGGPKKATTGPVENECVKTNTCKAIEVIDYAELSGSVLDASGKPIVGAKVIVKLKNTTSNAVTDEKGGFSVAKLPIGKTVDGKKSLDDTGAELAVDVTGKKPAKVTLTLVEGANTAPAIKLEAALPPGQLRGTVRSSTSGKPISGATVTVEPGGTSATTDSDGRFTMDLPPGTYKATATANGLAAQQLDVTIEPDPNGAAVIKNFELHK